MPDWRSSMQQTYEYCIVDPGTWKDVKRLDTVKSCSISRDSDANTLGSATINVGENPGECYIRAYLVTIQNGVTERHPLGTFLVQSPTAEFDGRTESMSLDAYTPLLELKENPPPLGYAILEGKNVMESAYMIAREHARAPVVQTVCDSKLYSDFVSNTNDTWLTFLIDLISNAKYEFDLDELGRILFAPKQDIESLQPVWTFTDGVDSIMYPEITVDRDLYGIPNVVEIIYSKGFYDTETGEMRYHLRVVNDDDSSPVSVQKRGREIIHREIDPSIAGVDGVIATARAVENYAESMLKTLSSVEYSVKYTHAYCPVRRGDCVRLNYARAGLVDIKAKVISQTIECKPGCPVTEKAVFNAKLWR
jgi:hypothetical protein